MIVGLDMGGTHVDGVIVKDGLVIRTIKRPTNRDDLFSSIWTTLEALVSPYDTSQIQRINLSTTVSTNAIVERKTSPVGMLIQAGPGIVNDFSACGDTRQSISGSIDHRGVVVRELQMKEIYKALQLFKEKKITTLAVVGKFSTRNPNHEIQISQTLKKEFDSITLGHRMSGKLNFPRRVTTSYLNSAVHATFHDFSENIKESLKKEGIEAPLFILKADAGTMDMDTAEERPVETILSGPAASFMGISALMPSDEDAILLDVGGTTTDIFFLADGVPLFEPLGATITGYNTLVHALYSASIGLGGDSCITIDNKKIIIGPERKGQPYAFGGPEPTPTDAMIYLDLIDISEKGPKEKAEEALTLLGKELDLPTAQIAPLILKTMVEMIKDKTDQLLAEIHSKPVYTIRELLHGKKIRPTSIKIIGGPAKALAPLLESRYKLPCMFPENYDVANAIGAALAKPTLEITMLADTSLGILSVAELGVYEKIPKSYSLQEAKERALKLLEESYISMGFDTESLESEITEESSFNMVDGFRTTGKNMRIKAQIKPGNILLRSTNHES